MVQHTGAICVHKGMLRHQFPDLQWLKQKVAQRFVNSRGQIGWPTVILNVKAGETYRDNIVGPLSFFSNDCGSSIVSVGKGETRVPDDFFFMSNPGEVYTLGIERRAAATTFNIHFGERWAEDTWLALHASEKDLNNGHSHATGRFEFYNKLYRKDATVIALISQLRHADNQEQLKRDQLLYMLLAHLMKEHYSATQKETLLSATRESTRKEILRRLHLATDYIHAGYCQSITLEDLSEVSSLSRFHFLREFRRAFGKAPHQYVMELRMQKAKTLLQDSTMDIQDVGRAVGFDTASSFSRQFKNQTGSYPGAWREASA